MFPFDNVIKYSLGDGDIYAKNCVYGYAAQHFDLKVRNCCENYHKSINLALGQNYVIYSNKLENHSLK